MSITLPPALACLPSETLEPRAHDAFQHDFGAHVVSVLFQAQCVIMNRSPHPANSAREHTYWHMVTEGQPEEQRILPIEDRLAKIPWARPVLENATDPEIKVWFSPRYTSGNYCVWYSKANYLVVVKQLTNGFLLKTAYTPDYTRVTRLHQEYAASKHPC